MYRALLWAWLEVGALAMEAGEIEFLAEKELVTITPNFSENKMTLISVSQLGCVRLACSSTASYQYEM